MKNIKKFVSAIIVAAGKGTRMNLDINKQYMEICDQPVLARTLNAFEMCKLINEVILVVNESDIFYCKENIVEFFKLNKIKKIVCGGKERQNSVYNGLLEISKHSDIVVIHDGARPFISEEIIGNCISGAYEYNACTAAVPVKDTIKGADINGFVEKTYDRKTLWSIQTPQAFRYDIIVKAHEKGIEDKTIVTDDTSLTEYLGYPTKLVMGSYDNIKITTIEDLEFGKAIIEKGLAKKYGRTDFE
ncbi:UNVERIFIED_CONTAM: 2-C-methyl-D-erythritol 4-phosphate cytidylyltransferase [Acetivibrio alkalicellulosi]